MSRFDEMSRVVHADAENLARIDDRGQQRHGRDLVVGTLVDERLQRLDPGSGEQRAQRRMIVQALAAIDDAVASDYAVAVFASSQKGNDLHGRNLFVSKLSQRFTRPGGRSRDQWTANAA